MGFFFWRFAATSFDNLTVLMQTGDVEADGGMYTTLYGGFILKSLEYHSHFLYANSVWFIHAQSTYIIHGIYYYYCMKNSFIYFVKINNAIRCLDKKKRNSRIMLKAQDWHCE